ncbi:hypothetical protein BGZ60DRAFT_531319 [Tricladium varicosporioides]|nr:hypothetical protein BGZ60DRAFT_531319 [Hymenoscyphus varicosporioides]
MVQAMRMKIFAIVLLCLCINLAIGERWGVHIHRRDGPTTSSITSASSSPAPSQTGSNKAPQPTGNSASSGGESSSTTVADKSASENAKATTSATTNATSIASSTLVASTVSAVTSNIVGPAATSSTNNSPYNSTATPGKLPIEPVVTPGFAVAGVILLLTGAVYTVVGIKNKWLHIFLSAAYLASVAVIVLILYVMNLPVSNAIQGAYVVAAVMTGLILGGGAIVFTEMTEGLGCLLGGFCLSMWLLVLKPGGLLTSTGGKSIFIAVFTIVAFATSFSHYTRPYGLIIFISFGGATAVVMGIDCFSRAGLKEFWAYLWDLNSNLFPIGATTYPLTRGIRVEIAAIIVLFLAGIVSQMKLWKVIKERREQRAAEKLQDERNMEQEEENVGRRVEDLNAEERSQWEAIYGDKDLAAKSTSTSQRDSGVGDMDSQKKGPRSVVTTITRNGEEDIEMSDLQQPTNMSGAGLVMNKNGQDGTVTVRVCRDAGPEPELDEKGNPIIPSHQRNSQVSSQQHDEDSVWVVGADGEARLERRPSRGPSKRSNPPLSVRVSGAPEVVPLPFRVPEGEVDDDRSSVATFADEQENGGQSPTRKHNHRLSAGSNMLRKLSQRSRQALSPSPRNSKRFSVNEGPSTEDLVIPHGIEDDRASSIAATMDGLSDDEEMRSVRSSIDKVPDTNEARSPDADTAPTTLEVPKILPLSMTDVQPEQAQSIDANTETAKEEIAEKSETATKSKETEALAVPRSVASSADPKPDAALPSASPSESGEPKRGAASIVSGVQSRAASLSKAHLPPQLSRVVMSYRTNEWAKHLSNADAPEVDELKIEEYPTEVVESEEPAPVNVEALQQTAENATQPPAPRTTSAMSNHAPTPLSRSGSNMSKDSPYGMLSQENLLQRSLSQQSLGGMSSQQSHSRFRTSSTPLIPQPIVESPIEEGFASQSPNLPPSAHGRFSSNGVPFGTTNTLMGRRDSMIRNKPSYYNAQTALPSTPEVPGNAVSQSNFQFPAQYASIPASRAGSDAGSLYNYQQNASNPMLMEDDDNMSLSARRDIIRQSSLQQLSQPIVAHPQAPLPFDSHQPRRQSSAPSPAVREQQLASWRASVQHDLQSAYVPKQSIERQRSALWHERQAEEQRRAIDARKKGERDSAFDERMRRGDMLDAHREALRKMQAGANKNA